ncbi:MAG: hypothetical protein ACOZQL_17725 [Myxococcota bacterium]
MRALLCCSVAVVLSACPAPNPEPDASAPFDAGVEPVACDSPEDCAGFGGVCRRQVCETDVPCGDDLECGLGERCVGHQCRFRGCTTAADCATGFCDVATFSCAECGRSADCPVERPVCDAQLRQCVQCTSDAQCAPPGPAHCADGRCVGCLENSHCPNGLQCSSGHFCVGAPANAPCPEGVSCGEGLVCVSLNTQNVCLPACTLYQPQCGAGEICYALTFTSTSSLVFEAMGPIGVCFSAQPGLRGLREACQRTAAGSNCQPNLRCVPESASLSLCRQFCNPFASGTCPGEKCTAFVGDYSGREYGLCLPDTGFGAKCRGDRDCRAALSCQPYDDPSELDEVGAVCQFNLGDAGVAAPCAPQPLADGGSSPADRACRSGRCVSDPLVTTPATAPYFCLGTCESDADCGDAGVCDADFPVTTASSTSGSVRGCRPTCRAESECAAFDAGVTCRLRVVSSASAPQLSATCSPSAGALAAGAPCTVNGQCRSGLCALDDARGVRRAGVCAAPCIDGAACAASGFPLDCQPTATLVSRGFDGVPLTSDDRLLTPRLCSGAACTHDADCRPDGGTAVCAPTPSAVDPLGALVLRCQPPTSGTLGGGEPCTSDAVCASGVCGLLQPPSTGSGRACFEACDGARACAGATMVCRAGGMRVATASGSSATVDSCAP